MSITTPLGPGCEGCLFLMRQDNGYSNYTVTDTDIYCLQRCNPHIPEGGLSGDVESARFNEALKYGETCRERVAGEGPWYDVDGEVTDETYKDRPQVYEAIKMWRLFQQLRDNP